MCAARILRDSLERVELCTGTARLSAVHCRKTTDHLCRFGVSKALYEEFLRPLLLVGLFAPPEELSAAAVLGTFYFYSAPLLCNDLEVHSYAPARALAFAAQCTQGLEHL